MLFIGKSGKKKNKTKYILVHECNIKYWSKSRISQKMDTFTQILFTHVIDVVDSVNAGS